MAMEQLEPLRPLAVEPAAGATPYIDLAGGDAAKEGRQYYVIVGSPKPSADSSVVRVTATPAAEARPNALHTPFVDDAWRQRVGASRAAMENRRRRQSAVTDDRPAYAAAKFSAERSFHLFVREDDFQDAANYAEVRAELVGVGSQCLVYVDRDDDPKQFPRDVVDGIIDRFDKHVFPTTRAVFGAHRDVDRDGRFTILITHWLGELSNGKVSIGGFVRGGDFYDSVPAPFSNQCDMMYLNSNVRPGEHLWTLLAHEYTHAITLSEHVFGTYLPSAGSQDEETWLSEALSHLAENIAGAGWSNLDYRISTYLNNPQQFPLVVPDYFRANRWRCHGSRGSTYLFLRWCVDRYGIELLRELSQSNLSGTANLEAATQTPFAELFRDWTVATTLDGVTPTVDAECGFHALGLRGEMETRLLAGPRPIPLTAGATVDLRLAPTSAAVLSVYVP
ncbi:MAG: hypothetical protein ACRDD1_03845, partial [Planctomycetia bacterium]